VAVGDLHGDLDAARAALRLGGVLEGDDRWAGGDTILVQTGDEVDRGDQGREVILLLEKLKNEAPVVGGRVVALLGNHEILNIQGETRYASDGDLAEFGGADARRAAFQPGGAIGKVLVARDATTRVGETVFVHGGIAPAVAALGIDAINSQVHAALLKQGGLEILGPEGPLWYRGYLKHDEPEACGDLGRALAALGAVRMVVGHTTQDDGRILARCHGALVDIDVGQAVYAGSHRAVLEIQGRDARALYPSGPEDLPDP